MLQQSGGQAAEVAREKVSQIILHLGTLHAHLWVLVISLSRANIPDCPQLSICSLHFPWPSPSAIAPWQFCMHACHTVLCYMHLHGNEKDCPMREKSWSSLPQVLSLHPSQQRSPKLALRGLLHPSLQTSCKIDLSAFGRTCGLTHLGTHAAHHQNAGLLRVDSRRSNLCGLRLVV